MRRGVDLGRGEVVALGDAERGVVLAQDGVDLFGEPGLVAELEGDGGACRVSKRESSEEVLRGGRGRP